MKPSLKWQWNEIDTLSWVKNALWVLIPTLLVFLPSLIGIIPVDWKYAALIIYFLNRVTDALKKWQAGK